MKLIFGYYHLPHQAAFSSELFLTGWVFLTVIAAVRLFSCCQLENMTIFCSKSCLEINPLASLYQISLKQKETKLEGYDLPEDLIAIRGSYLANFSILYPTEECQ